MTTDDRFSAPLQDEPKCNKGTSAVEGLGTGSGDRGREPKGGMALAIGEVNCFDKNGVPVIRFYPSAVKAANGAQVFVVLEGGGREPNLTGGGAKERNSANQE